MASKLERARTGTGTVTSSAALDLDRPRPVSAPADGGGQASETETETDVPAAEDRTPAPLAEEPGVTATSTIPPTLIAVNATSPVLSRDDLRRIVTDAAQSALASVTALPAFDVYDDRVTLTLSGTLIAQLREQWAMYLTDHPGDRLPFSAWLAARIYFCRTHTADKHIYLSGAHLSAIERIAAQDFQTAAELLGWIEVTHLFTLTSPDGQQIRLDAPIDPQVWDRLTDESRRDEGESLSSYLSRVISESLLREVGLL